MTMPTLIRSSRRPTVNIKTASGAGKTAAATLIQISELPRPRITSNQAST